MSSAAEMERYQRRMDDDLELAGRVHRSMIPRNERRGNLEVACSFTPMLGVGGDYASVFFQSETKVVVSVCDVTGHRVAAALLASRVNSFVLNNAPAISHPCQMGESLNSFFFEFFGKTRLLASFFCLFLDLKSRSLTYAGFGHPPVFLLSQTRGTTELLRSENTLIGIAKDLVHHCSMLTLPFESQDRLILYTDGISESENKRGEQLELPQLQKIVQQNAHLPTAEHINAITESIAGYREGTDPHDDQLLLAVSFL